MNVLITGGSRGIGKAVALELERAGHNLLLVSRDEDNLKKTVKELINPPRANIGYTVCDVSSEEEIEKLLHYCEEVEFSPNVLVLNAGIFIEGSLASSQSEELYETMRTNLYHVYHCVKKFLSLLKKQKHSKIIIIGSTASLEPYPVGALYGVSKWALKGYALNLRKELMEDGIAVTLINPGGTLTDLWEGEVLPPGRLLEPSDIGKLVSSILELSSQAVVEEIIIRPMLGDIHE